MFKGVSYKIIVLCETSHTLIPPVGLNTCLHCSIIKFPFWVEAQLLSYQPLC